jgi:hypothetical protein
VFLLTGIAGMPNAMAGRLARSIDRGRRHLASAAITACTLSARHLAACDGEAFLALRAALLQRDLLP